MNITVSFDFSNNLATFEYNGKRLEKEFRITSINNFTKMAFITLIIGEGHHWEFNWTIWAEREQFFEFAEYKRSEDYSVDPTTTFAKWSYIKNPQPGTIQTNQVKCNVCNVYRKHLFPNIKNCPYGDWSNP